MRVLEKRRAAEVQWQKRAELIEKGEMPDFWDELKARGYVKDIAGTDKQIKQLMREHRISAYVGIDPTAPSLHLGHLIPFMVLAHMYMNGYGAYSIVGGATGKVGDPTGRLNARDKTKRSIFAANLTKVHYQLKQMWGRVDTQAARFGYEKDWAWRRSLLNNSQWYNSLGFMEPVARLFSGMRLSTMLSRETVKRRMEEGDGMSLAEFVYPCIQAWDWWWLFSEPRNVVMQIGGSDQYGNIVAGIEAIKYLRDTEPDAAKRIPKDLAHTPVGFTTPLLTDASGNKFGKSAGNAVWLDPFMTSSYDLYGYFMRRPDNEVEKLLNLFTFLPRDSIGMIMEEHNKDPRKRVAHHAVALEVLMLVHGQKIATETQQQHIQMYGRGKDVVQVKQPELERVPSSGPLHSNASFKPDIELPESLINKGNIARILYNAGLANSVSEAARLTHGRGAYIAGAPGQAASVNKGLDIGNLTFTPVKTWFPHDTKNFLIDGELLILRRGKHFLRIIRVVSDEEWKASGQKYEGEPGTGAMRDLRKAVSSMKKDAKVRAALMNAEGGSLAEESEPLESWETNQILDELKAEARALDMEERGTIEFPEDADPSTTKGGKPKRRFPKRLSKIKPPDPTLAKTQRRLAVIEAYKRQLPQTLVMRIQKQTVYKGLLRRRTDGIVPMPWDGGGGGSGSRPLEASENR